MASRGYATTELNILLITVVSLFATSCATDHHATSTAFAIRAEQISNEVGEIFEQFETVKDLCEIAVKIPRHDNYRDASQTLYLRIDRLIAHDKYEEHLGYLWIGEELVRIHAEMQRVRYGQWKHPSIYCLNLVDPTPVP